MRNPPFGTCLFLSLFLSAATPLLAKGSSSSPRFGVGVNIKGGQLDWRPSPQWMLELRHQQDSVSDPVATKSSVTGMRGYRLFRAEAPTFFLTGLEVAAVEASQKNTPYQASGFSGGAFIGLGRELGRHFVFTVDAGPYWVQLKETRTDLSSSHVDFVGDAAVLFMFW
jgi:hypothetical protein